MTQRLQCLLEVLDGHRVYIQTHNFPDPDALASAYGMQQLLSVFGIDAVICCKGMMEKASTSGMVDIFGIELVNINDIEDMTADDYVLTIDAQANNSNIADIPGKTAACIDHHPTAVPYEYLFRDVRICGACASLVADYFFSNKVAIDKNTATALMYGLKMDTDDLNRGMTDIDVEMYRRLFYYTDQDKLNQILSQQMVFSDLNDFIAALRGIKVFDGIGFTAIADGASDGLIAEVCDFMLDLVEVQFAVAYSMRDGGVKISVRSELNYLDAGTITANALEEIGAGGGHGVMAGGYIPKSSIENAEFDLEEEIQNRFINAVYFSRMLKNALNDPLAEIPD